MRIAFVDCGGWSYGLDAPFKRPMGGTESALCYLAVELARLGHAITVYNGTPAPTESCNVDLRNVHDILSPGHLNAFDAVVALSAAIGRSLRRDYRVTVPMVLWTQHAYAQPAIRELSRLNERKCWTAFAFVSNWQRERYEKFFWIPREKGRVLRNAVSPAFAAGSERAPWFTTGGPPVLFYTSTPFRGLDVLLKAFPAIRSAVAGTRLRVFSSMGVYQIPPEKDEYRDLYDRCRATDGVEYVGSVGQSRLAEELAGGAALAYPSTFAETSCIAVLEAMALGAAVFATRLGALPETSGGLASMIDWQSDEIVLAGQFADMAIEALRLMRSNPAAAEAQRRERIKFIHDNYLWPARANEWAAWLAQLSTGKTGPAPALTTPR
ncbi:MAG TPA: glycosyltransferase family 4 protein [Xanthobacteraceae bacterium]|nr:glycosyltransferase family 4 protein [Xanthobacteraceae bacterium]